MTRRNATDSELRFTRYRLHVVEGWPESQLKNATVEAIRDRLRALQGEPPKLRTIPHAEYSRLPLPRFELAS